MNFFISNFVSFVVGLGSSYGVWFYIQKFLIPKIVFAEHLNRYEIPDGRYIWRTKILNSGKRDIIDLEIIVRIGIKEFKGANGWAYHSIKANTSRAPILKKNSKLLLRTFDPREPVQFIDNPSLSIKNAIMECQTLDDIFSLGTDASISIHVFGYDSFSGIRQHFSKSYKSRDFKEGTYDNNMNVIKNTKILEYKKN